MASGRVGGTRSRVTGAVGDVVYQVRRNDDGTYTQIVMSKRSETTSTTTPKLQAQRMVTAMVESMMKQLKEVATISFQSGANKSKSLNAFSSYNLQLVARDMQAHWYGSNDFVYPRHNDNYSDDIDLGGLYCLSAGTLQFNLFEDWYVVGSNWRQWPEINEDYLESVMIRWNLPDTRCTVDDFFSRYRITPLDTIVFCAFLAKYITPSDPDGEETEIFKHCYAILKPNPDISGETVITRENFGQIFNVKSNFDFTWTMKIDGSQIGLAFSSDNYTNVSIWGYCGAFSISYLEGKKKISTAYYKSISHDEKPWMYNSAPTNVFSTWMGEGNNSHYPSPFE